MTVGVIHPGEMGAALGAVLAQSGETVCFSSAGRSEATRARAEKAGLVDTGTLEALLERCDVVLSVCPPHAAQAVGDAVASSPARFRGLFVDANAISPTTLGAIARRFEATEARVVDGGIIGSPPRSGGKTALYLSGASADDVARIFDKTPIDVSVLSVRLGDASALKLAYAAWTKGSAALLLIARAAAARAGVEEPLLGEWRRSQPDLVAQSERAGHAAATKGWRWVGEMEEIAAMLDELGLPDGFHLAAGTVFATAPREQGVDLGIEVILEALRATR